MLIWELTALQAISIDMDEKASTKKETSTTPAHMDPLSYPTLSRMESGMTPWSSLKLRGGVSFVNTPHVSLIHGAGRGCAGSLGSY